MTQQALRELVAKWRRELREVDSDRDNYSPPSADYFASELESLLGEQREARGDIAPENKEYVGLVCPICLIQLHPSAVLSDVVEHYYGNGTCPLYGKDFDARLMRGWQPKAPPLAESMGDVEGKQ